MDAGKSSNGGRRSRWKIGRLTRRQFPARKERREARRSDGDDTAGVPWRWTIPELFLSPASRTI